MRKLLRRSVILSFFALTPMFIIGGVQGADYTVVDTGQAACYDDASEITCPASGQVFYG